MKPELQAEQELLGWPLQNCIIITPVLIVCRGFGNTTITNKAQYLSMLNVVNLKLFTFHNPQGLKAINSSNSYLLKCVFYPVWKIRAVKPMYMINKCNFPQFLLVFLEVICSIVIWNWKFLEESRMCLEFHPEVTEDTYSFLYASKSYLSHRSYWKSPIST